eukprot:CAMPEP_0184496212 /NCGR_PEP_ID=MMETSP0113_2-20130426/33363_1 /TAXON_ID=91329 /ORGANISM="Norrisiella sphaerica, Strain BC52" /LENGTH=289 /DNA_ID=CAMNT_0026882737 /DNA_START=1 /DNA_END=870 /DNA_ORIENTATION=-
MSFGFSNPHDPLSTDQKARQSAVMRGPMASGVIQRLANDTDWGDLDYLIVDFPPGTGDIQLTLAQNLNFASAVVVTTPQRLAHVDVVKGLDMFDKVKVPTIALVENMAYLDCKCGERLHPFGQGKTEKLVELFGLKEKIVQLPIMPQISEYGDSGDPLVLSEDPIIEGVVQAYSQLADLVVSETASVVDAKAKHGQSIPIVTADAGIVKMTYLNGESIEIPCPELRRRCKSAGNFNPERIPDSVAVKEVQPRGNYAVSISWTDGHNSIYPYDAIEEAARCYKLTADDPR